MTITLAIFLFGFLIFIHELGHFIFAKMSGVKVLKFSLGFGPKIIGKKIGDTEYLLSAIPLGGYVKMLGQEDVGEVEEETDAAEPDRSFRNQSVTKKAAIVFAGPVFNILTAVVIFFFIYLIGTPTLLPVVGEIMPDTPAEKAMLAKGDRVMEINGSPIKYWSDMTEIIHNSPDKTLAIKIQRNSEIFEISIIPEGKAVKDIFGEDKKIGLIGVKPSDETVTVAENLPDALIKAFLKVWEIIVLTLMGVVKLIQRIIPADTIGGPILIFQLAEKQASAGMLSYFLFAAVISINLGILNLLPIPILDGGHLLFLGIEAIRKKPLSDKVMMIAQRIGLVLILSLMAFAMYNDIFRLFNGEPIP